MSGNRRALLAAAVALPAAGAAAYASERIAADNRLRDAVRRFEVAHEAPLLAIVSSPSVADALARADVRALETILLPLRVAYRIDLIDVVGADGKMLSALRTDRFGERALSLVDSAAGSWQLTTTALKSALPASPSAPVPTPAAVVHTKWGEALYRAIGVPHGGRIVGAILVGTPLEDALTKA